MDEELKDHNVSSTPYRKKTTKYAQQKGDVIEMPPMEITVSKKRKEKILRKAGWKKATVMITVKDFRGRPMLGRKVLVESQAPKVVPQVEGKDVRGGGVIFSDFWIKPAGIIRIMAISTGRPAELPTGVAHYTLPKNNVLKIAAKQKSSEVEITATSAEEAANKAGAKGTAGIDFKVISIGGEVSGETERRKGTSISKKYKVIKATDTLELKIVS